MALTPGMTHEIEFTVAHEHSAARFNRNLPEVLSTPQMIGWMETTGQFLAAPELEEGQSTVGASVNIRHLAATPLGMHVRVQAELLEVDRRRLKFRVQAWDEEDLIGEGEHERFIIDCDRFTARLAEKQGRMDAAGAQRPQ